MNILLTGGAGYIGSHAVVALAAAGHTPIVLDDFSNSHPQVLERLRRLLGVPVRCELGSVADVTRTRALMERHQVHAVIHFAAYKAVGESVSAPLKYYDNNIRGLVRLLQAMDAAGCRNIVFSSSATVYGQGGTMPIAEDAPRGHTNPYGHTKLVCEEILGAVQSSSRAWRVAILRYFNPAGAHVSGLIGEDPGEVPNNLMPYVSQVACGKRPYLVVHGDDYPTPDGTGVRDYIHVEDLAAGHVRAVEVLADSVEGFTINLGTGQGHSVLEVLHTYEEACGREIPYRVGPRRPGDVPTCWADVSRARALLEWRATRTLHDMCVDAWRWQSRNPEGLRRPAPVRPEPATQRLFWPGRTEIPYASPREPRGLAGIGWRPGSAWDWEKSIRWQLRPRLTGEHP
ncbi:UDP-glucose 4-epimerase GalE [Ramlibacter rhizophilus]|uniref:UDP-glucose 4-epimerase n=1 Tax=Ramlibacter rhizophilus TaxID=1781167 RepID=A0A4Z0BG57_9BURK|nr:UDP-glucose 4-epimerase GalE [Ramlibacter rhizophilus]